MKREKGLFERMSTIDLSKFEKKMIIRNIKPDDIDEILALQKLSFPGMCRVRRGNYRILFKLDCEL
jgi:mRNA-degrading endonuclease RelE of RelBE toxin-antitoxin system